METETGHLASRRKSVATIAGIKAKALSQLEDWNSDITGALDKLFLQAIAGVVPYKYCPPKLTTLTQHSRDGKHTKAPQRHFSTKSFLCSIKYSISFYCNPPCTLWLVRVTQVSSHPPGWWQTWHRRDEDGSSHTHVPQQLNCSQNKHGASAWWAHQSLKQPAEYHVLSY